ncbi:MAG: methenyltetrahydromethanopterin cyclohydrolase [Promethearchaeota archaeon]|nr:MAG: methenyltetrahydromethanopterin cyclohydrolase [Candidatus Lokiarchaeota archaeon]
MKKIHHVKINELALKLVNKIIDNKELYGAEIKTLSNGSTVVDMTNASWIGGKLVGEICMGGLGSVEFTSYELDGTYLPAVNVHTSEPIISCMASQLAGWSVKLKKEVEKDGQIKKKVVFQSLGSGPARAKAKTEKLFDEIDYTDDSDCAILVFETRKMPDEEVMAIITEKTKVPPNKTFAVCAPTACLTGSIQVAARIVETGIHKLHEIHFPLDIIQDGFGTTTIAPIAKDDFAAMGTTNDSIIAAGRTFYTIKADKEKEAEIFELIRKAPANTSSSYGKPFNDIFKEANYDFYKIDPGLFAPATYTLNNITTGKTITVGKVNHELLKLSYGL